MTTFTLTSPNFRDNDTLPLAQVHGDAGGANQSPALRWENPPVGTKSFALSCYDPDAPTGSGFWHWYIINLPADLRSLDENAAANLPAGARHARNDYGDYNYGGACPPPGDKPHRYIYTLYALDSALDLPADATPAVLGFSLNGKVLASGQLTGTYGR